MTNRKSKRLLSLLLSLVMVFSLTATPMFAADEEDTSSGTKTSEAQETGSASAVTLSEPEAVEEDEEAYASEDDTSEEVTADQQEDLNGGISLASTDEDSSDNTSEENEEESTVDSALPAADESGVITLTGDVELTGQYIVTSGGNVTIDLNGHYITRGTDNTYNFIIVVNSGATLTIKDSNPSENTIAGGVYAYGTLNIESGTIAPSTNWGVEVNGGTVTVSGGTINAYYGIIVDSGSLEVKDGATITGTNRAVEVGSGATATISGGTLSGGTYGVYVLGSGSATVSGGTISATNGIIVASGSLEVKDGATITGTNRAVEVGTSSATATITGGTLSGTYAVMNFGGTLNISGGDISGTNTGIYHNSGTTTVTDGTIYGTYYGARIYGGTLGASGGSVSCGERTNAFTYGIYVDSSNSAATVTLSGTVEVTANNTKGYGAAVALFNTLNGNDSASGVVTTLNVQDNATLTGSSYGISGNGSYSGNQVTKITISGGTVTGDWGIYHPQCGDMTITGGTITGTSTGIEMRAGNLTVTGGSIIAEGDPGSSTENGNGTTTVGAAIAVVQHTTKRDINVTVTEAEGSTTTLSGYYGIFEADLEGNGETTENVTIAVEAGTVTTTSDDEGSVAIYHDASSYATVSVTGGTYSTDVADYCSTIYTTSDNGDGTYSIVEATAVASIGDTEYATLARAFAAAQEGDTITLLANITLSETLVYSNSVSATLDLNGKTITFAYDDDGLFNGKELSDGAYGLRVSNGTLTIQDSSEDGIGTIQTADENSYVDVVCATDSAKLYIKSGNYTTNSIYEAVVYAGGEAMVSISGGTFTNSAEYYKYNSDFSGIVLNVGNSSTATITVTGGTFYGESPASGDDSSSSSSTQSNFVAEGYDDYAYGTNGFVVAEANEDAVALVYDGNGSYVGTYTTLKAAYNAVTTGGTMILVKDVDGEQLGASSDKEVTLDLNGHTISKSSGSVIDCSKGTLTITDSSQTDSALGKGMVKGTGGVALKLSGGSVILESGTLESTSTYAVTMTSGALTVNGGAVIAASTATYIVRYTAGTLIVNNGLFTLCDRDSNASTDTVTSGAIVSATSDATKESTVQVSITGGVFQMYRPLLGTTINLEITGGCFLSKYSLNNYTPDGYGFSKVDSYTYLGKTYSSYYQVLHSNFTLEVTTTTDDEKSTETSYYSTLVEAKNEAISAYNRDNTATITITLNNDYETGKVPVESEVVFTLDLNGYTLTSTDKGAFKISNANVEVTITDNSEAGIGTITTVDSESVTSSTTGLLQVINGTLYITGGYFDQNAGASVFVVGSSGNVIVTGGYFTENPTDYVEENYEVATNDDADYPYYVADIISGKNIDLTSGVIQMNVYINDTEGEDTFSATPSPVGETKTWTLDDYTGSDVVADKVMTVKVMAKKMSVDFTVTVELSNGYTTSYTTSVAEYLNELLEEGSGASEANQKIAKALLDYGSAVQQDSGFVTEEENLANGGSYSASLSGYTATAMKEAGVTKKTTYTGWTSSTTPVAFTSLNMAFGYDFDLILTYSADLSSYADNVTVTIGGTDYSGVTVSGTTITISGLTAVQLNSSFVITVSDGTNSYATTMSGLYYARLLANKDSTTYATKVKLGQALYAYATSLTATESD